MHKKSRHERQKGEITTKIQTGNRKGVKILLSEKENSILDKAEDAILRRFEDCLKGTEPMSSDDFEGLMDGIRVLDRICRMKYQQTSHSDKSVGTSSTSPSKQSQS